MYCIAQLEQIRWSNESTCPYRNSTNISRNQHHHHCHNCKTSFSVTVGTIFGADFSAIMLMLNAKQELSTLQLSRALDVNENTAWRIAIHHTVQVGHDLWLNDAAF